MPILRWLFWHWLGSWGKEMPWPCCWEGVYQAVCSIPRLSPAHVPWHLGGAWDGPGGWLWKEDMGSGGWALGKSAHKRGRPWGAPVPQGPEEWVWGRAGRSVKMTVRKYLACSTGLFLNRESSSRGKGLWRAQRFAGKVLNKPITKQVCCFYTTLSSPCVPTWAGCWEQIHSHLELMQ